MKCPIILLVTTRSHRFKIGDAGSSVPELGCQLERYSSSPKAWSVMNIRSGLLVGEARAKLPRHASDGDGAVEPILVVALLRWRWLWRDFSTESCWQWRDVAAESWWRWHCWGDVGRGAVSLSSHDEDDVAKSCWRWHCRGDFGYGLMSLSSLAGDAEAKLAVAWCCFRVMLAMAPSSRHWLWHDVAAKSCWRWRRVTTESCWRLRCWWPC
jgi:hypothetical protein